MALKNEHSGIQYRRRRRHWHQTRSQRCTRTNPQLQQMRQSIALIRPAMFFSYHTWTGFNVAISGFFSHKVKTF
jgi:hypothetical protein